MALPVVNPQHPPSAQGFARLAREAATRFRGKHLRVRHSEVVHAVGWYRWIGRLYLPGPACRTGWAGVGAQGDLHAVEPSQPITCHKCAPTAEAEIMRRFVPEPARQLRLDEVEPDELALFAPPEPDADHHR